jgi:hypothetical protein
MTPRRGRITAQSGHGDTKRWQWAWEQRRAPAFEWPHSDESTVSVQETGDIVWGKRGGPTPAFEVTTLRCHVNIWGLVWNEGSIYIRTLRRQSRHTDSSIELLEEHLLPPERESLGGCTLLIDQHVIGVRAQTWLIEPGWNFVMLPPHSPRFNGIEECWSRMKRYVCQLQPKWCAHRWAKERA